MAENDVTPLQFSDVCDLLGLEPDYLRSRLREWRARQVAQPPVGPPGPRSQGSDGSRAAHLAV